MEKINYRKQELYWDHRLLRIIESCSEAAVSSKRSSNGAEQELASRLELLSGLGIRPKWKATRSEVEEMISQYKLILNSVRRHIP